MEIEMEALGSADTREAARILFGDDGPRAVARLEFWAREGTGPKFFKASSARSAKRWYPRQALLDFMNGVAASR